MAGVCAVCGTTVDGVTYPAIGDAQGGFYSDWVHNAIEIIDWLHARGKNVVWVVSPPWGSTRTPSPPARRSGSRPAPSSSMYDAAVLAPYASAALVDWTSALGDTNRQYATLLWYDNENHEVRTDDKTHFTLEGATRAATWTAAALVDLFARYPRRPTGRPRRSCRGPDRGGRPGHPAGPAV